MHTVIHYNVLVNKSCVNCWIANKEGQGPRRNFDARFLLSYGKNLCFLDIASTSGFQLHRGYESFVDGSPEDILCT